MAKQQNGYLGGYSGRLGPVVGYLWRGKWCLRVKPGKVHNPRTDRQQSHRHLFKAMVQFASRQSQVLRIGMRQVSHDEGMTEQNLFVSLNSQSFSLVDGALEVDYSRLLFSCGPVAPVAFGKPAVDDRRVLTVSFERNPLHMRSSGEDTVYLYAYCPAAKRGLLSAPVYRRSQSLSMMLPDEWEGEEVYLYGFVTDYAGRASQSVSISWDGVEGEEEEATDNNAVAHGHESDALIAADGRENTSGQPQGAPGGFS